MYIVTSISANCKGNISPTEIIEWSAGLSRLVRSESVQFYLDHPTEFTATTVNLAPLDDLSSEIAVLYEGKHAAGNIDFNGVGEAGTVITIGGVEYTEADTAVPATGTWTNGASAADGATSLIAAINGDTRAAVPVTAVADISGAGVWLFADSVGVAGNLVVTTDSAAKITAMALTGGVDSALKQSVSITHMATTQELLSGGVEIPLPFAPTTINIQVFSSTGAPVYTTDLVTIEATPNRVRITTTGATNVANTDVIHLIASR